MEVWAFFKKGSFIMVIRDACIMFKSKKIAIVFKYYSLLVNKLSPHACFSVVSDIEFSP